MSGFVADHFGAQVRVSPNFGPRLGVRRADMIILHYTGMETGEAAESWLCDPVSQVSSHYLVHEDGRIVQMVRESDRAWHAGRSSWRGVTDINSRSVGIEVVNTGPIGGHPPFPDAQIAAVIGLCRDICARLDIGGDHVLAHSDVAPGRKIDPGPAFPWETLAQAGVGCMPAQTRIAAADTLAEGAGGAEVERIQSMLNLYGYEIEITGIFDERTATVVRTFQLHFRRKRADGVVDAETRAILTALVSDMPKLP